MSASRAISHASYGWLVGAFVLAVLAGDTAHRGAWGVASGLAVLGVALAIAGVGGLIRSLGAQQSIAPWDRVRAEIERSRRQNSSLVVARVPMQRSPVASAEAGARRAGVVLRGSDAVWAEDRSIFLLLADTDRHSAFVGINRVVDELDESQVEAPLVASFPEDVLTLGGLIDQLYPPRRPRMLQGDGRRPEEVRPTLVLGDEQASA